jgi:hypothetical protein
MATACVDIKLGRNYPRAPHDQGSDRPTTKDCSLDLQCTTMHYFSAILLAPVALPEKLYLTFLQLWSGSLRKIRAAALEFGDDGKDACAFQGDASRLGVTSLRWERSLGFTSFYVSAVRFNEGDFVK